MSDRPPRPPSGPARRGGRARGGGGFDRIKAPSSGERGRPGGRAALFGEPAPASPPPPPRTSAAAPPGRGPVAIAAVHCRDCGATSPLDLLTVARGLVPFVVVPWADHPWWAVCPACGQRTWLRPEVLDRAER